jgi:pimeloyl-ACP methyl ester carboxylesterase
MSLFMELARRRAAADGRGAARPRAQTFAEDLAALADGLGLRAFFVVGVSGGGPYALAAAAHLPPGRVRGVLTISSPAPAGAAPPPARRGARPGGVRGGRPGRPRRGRPRRGRGPCSVGRPCGGTDPRGKGRSVRAGAGGGRRPGRRHSCLPYLRRV